MKEAKKESMRWLLQAKDDFKFVDWVKREGVFFDKGCFVAQQAGEKILKACLFQLYSSSDLKSAVEDLTKIFKFAEQFLLKYDVKPSA